MNKLRIINSIKTCKASAGLMLVALMTCHTAAADSAFKLTAIADDAKGHYVVDGDYSTAIEEIEGQAVKRFASETNLCVAYTVSGDDVSAKGACDNALTLIVEGKDSRDVRVHGNYRRSLALALSNRGVFRALTGDLQGAKLDLTRAVELHSNLRQAKFNLLRLEEKVDGLKTVAAS
jgi:hypothetical protein